jgi:hypothetical protein
MAYEHVTVIRDRRLLSLEYVLEVLEVELADFQDPETRANGGSLGLHEATKLAFRLGFGQARPTSGRSLGSKLALDSPPA